MTKSIHVMQDEGLNKNGELFLRKHPELKVKLVEGSSLATAVVLNNIPQGTKQVYTPFEDEYEKLKAKLSNEAGNNLVLSKHNAPKNWLGRRVMSAWRIAGIVHALEEWKVHECGNMMFDIERIWQASLAHGFRPLTNVPN
ncbi:UNVERIFIED_CONTAM: Very-long-chain aldehyde decarbonylase GL1-7 [Sesamum radiatum]|uniref:Very-long-chain aldehyde decarbonylase GL1-7 n=1 Tax=Sesamum radiatum TaxID=300843 RepID=A0AAW2R312_SESRA